MMSSVDVTGARPTLVKTAGARHYFRNSRRRPDGRSSKQVGCAAGHRHLFSRSSTSQPADASLEQREMRSKRLPTERRICLVRDTVGVALSRLNHLETDMPTLAQMLKNPPAGATAALEHRGPPDRR